MPIIVWRNSIDQSKVMNQGHWQGCAWRGVDWQQWQSETYGQGRRWKPHQVKYNGGH